MAGLKLVASSGEVAYVASTEKTGLQLQAPTNQRLLVKNIRVTGKQAAGGTDTPIKLRLTTCVVANAGTGTTGTPGKLNPSDPETVQSVVKTNNSAEPSSVTDKGMVWDIQPQFGVIEFWPQSEYIEVPGGQCLNFCITSGATPTLTITVGYEE